MNYKKAFPSKHLKGVDLDGDLTLTITSSAMEPVVDGDDDKLIIHFAETKQGLVCAKTNADTIAALYGEETEQWVGKRITLYFDETVMFGAKRTGGIRIRNQAPVVGGSAGTAANRAALEDRLMDLVMLAVKGNIMEIDTFLAEKFGARSLSDLSDTKLKVAIKSLEPAKSETVPF